mmetsp:Transcript_5887/g.9720  ORF Transcript_5887/g.9720 Transcript_5887/m.9720 type:complete len:246 (-) Transcript_5887:1704-2441(-)
MVVRTEGVVADLCDCCCCGRSTVVEAEPGAPAIAAAVAVVDAIQGLALISNLLRWVSMLFVNEDLTVFRDTSVIIPPPTPAPPAAAVTSLAALFTAVVKFAALSAAAETVAPAPSFAAAAVVPVKAAGVDIDIDIAAAEVSARELSPRTAFFVATVPVCFFFVVVFFIFCCCCCFPSTAAAVAAVVAVVEMMAAAVGRCTPRSTPSWCRRICWWTWRCWRKRKHVERVKLTSTVYSLPSAVLTVT